MPELPEVETTALALKPYVVGETIRAVQIHNRSLRTRIIPNIESLLIGSTVSDLHRRGKYLIFNLNHPEQQAASLLVHLGMSGSLRLSNAAEARRKHDHIELSINDHLLRYHDPRRFGLFEYIAAGQSSKWLQKLGVEPLQRGFNGDKLHQLCQGRKKPIKNLIMDASVVVGVGNIYASEALFGARIHPLRPANQLALEQCHELSRQIKKVLRQSIRQGGTTLRDFVSGVSNPGYFAQALKVYGRADQPCPRCRRPIFSLRLANRNTFYCPQCQPL